MGVGMVLVVPAHHEREVLSHLESVREPVYRIGEIVQGNRKVLYRG
jgi:phosphoribosylaminoimidazole (AIR) synthetase